MISKKTLTDVYRVLVRNLQPDQLTHVLSELQLIAGNKSYDDTIDALCKYHVDKIVAADRKSKRA
jgi:hypothetical protein